MADPVKVDQVGDSRNFEGAYQHLGYDALSDESIFEIAEGIHKGKIFTSNHVRKGDEQCVSMIFMVMMFNDDPSFIPWMLRCKIYVLFEYMDKASPRGINGYPIFTSCNFLDQSDWKRVCDVLKKLEESESKIKAEMKA